MFCLPFCSLNCIKSKKNDLQASFFGKGELVLFPGLCIESSCHCSLIFSYVAMQLYDSTLACFWHVARVYDNAFLPVQQYFAANVIILRSGSFKTGIR